MKKIIAFIVLISPLLVFAQIQDLRKAQDTRKKYLDKEVTSAGRFQPVQWVNPFVGTGGHGHTYPGATAPFGMVQFSPDTRPFGWDGCGGYHYDDSIIYGFSLTHLSGVGVSDLGDVLLVPQQGKIKTTPGFEVNGGYGATFSHQSEKASPGFYEVTFQDSKIQTQLTSGVRIGIARFTFSNTDQKKFLLIDLNYRDELLEGNVQTIGNNQIAGYRYSKAWAKNQHLFFHLETSIPFVKQKLIRDKGLLKLYVEFPKDTKELFAYVGISAVDAAGAKNNLYSELPEFPANLPESGQKRFDQVRASTTRLWDNELRKVEIQTSDTNVLRNFYTALYHTCLSPTFFTDADNRFLGNDGKIHQAENHQQYSVFSLWDTYRTAHPLYTLIQTKRTEDFIHSFLEIYKHTGELPMWELLGNETDCMIGYHAVSVILDAYRKGIRNFDSQLALDAMVSTATKNELGKQLYEKYGFLSSDQEPESVSKTIEYSYNDWCIQQFALELQNDPIAKRFEKRSYSFVHLFDPTTSFLRARKSGIWHSPFLPSEVNFNYTEANAWHYALGAQHTPELMAQLHGGNDKLTTWLDRLFTTQSNLEGRHQVDITGLIGQYAHGNEPSHHMAYMYHYSATPEKIAPRVQQILHEMYQPTPDGLIGNEDCGQMSAWYVMSSFGFYPVTPGSTKYIIGRPNFDKAIINLENGKKIQIRVEGNLPENSYVKQVFLNENEITTGEIDHLNLIEGGVLRFVLDKNPSNRNAKTVQPKVPEKVVSAPYFDTDSRTFKDELSFEIKDINKQLDPTFEYQIWFAKKDSLRFERLESNELCVLSDDATVWAKVAKVNPVSKQVVAWSPVVSNFFKKEKQLFQLELTSAYANQYAAGGKQALIDGLLGGADFRSGDWQGYEGIDATGILRFTEPTKIQSFFLRCLHDEHSWIYLPSAIEIEISFDGIHFEKPLRVETKYNPLTKESFAQKMEVQLAQPQSVKAIRFRAVNRGKNPKGHISEGEKSWIFLDELEVK